MADTLIASIEKNSREELRVSLTSYNGHDLATLRVWFEDRASGELRPGKHGVAIRLTMLGDVIQALQDLRAEAERRGLMR